MQADSEDLDTLINTMKHAAAQASLPGYDDALELILPHAPQLQKQPLSLNETLGRTLCRDILADCDQPRFDRSAMDGFALRHETFHQQTCYTTIGTAPAGAPIGSFSPRPNEIVRIATGAPVPHPFDAVIPIEQATIRQDGSRERVQFLVDSCQPWQNVHRQASDAHRGQIVLHAGTIMAPNHIGIAATVGATLLEVTERPRITVLTTGDELRPVETATTQLEPQQIRNSNAPMLGAFFRALGVPVLKHMYVSDEPQKTLAAARKAMSQSHLVVTVGGVSAGQRDLLPWAWKKLGLKTVLHGIAIQPGRPVFVAIASTDEVEGNKLIIGLPGNPVSVLATAHLILWPVLRRMFSSATDENKITQPILPWRQVVVKKEVMPKAKRQVFRAARLLDDSTVSVITWHGSGDLMHTAAADGWLRLPLQDYPVQASTNLPFLPMVG